MKISLETFLLDQILNYFLIIEDLILHMQHKINEIIRLTKIIFLMG